MYEVSYAITSGLNFTCSAGSSELLLQHTQSSDSILAAILKSVGRKKKQRESGYTQPLVTPCMSEQRHMPPPHQLIHSSVLFKLHVGTAGEVVDDNLKELSAEDAAQGSDSLLFSFL